MALGRREFLFRAGLTTLGLTLVGLKRPSCALAASGGAAAATTSYGDWREVYRERWSWDRIVKSSHFTNCWYQSHCAWNVYVKDGVVWREEQVAAYPQTNSDLPDFNPRGCQKGACYSERMYDPARVRYPMKRIGERGSGKWKRITWDEAFADLSEEFVRVVSEEGPSRIVWDNGPLFTFGAMALAEARFSYLAGTVSLDMNSEIGDAHRGAAETFGKIVFERSADDYFYSDLILIWGCNPVATQIPNAHFLTEARYNGAKIVTIAPDYSPSSIHADMWVPVRPGTDAAFALAVAKILIDEKRYDAAFVKEQTDLPILVRDDSGQFLRACDLEAGESDETFYWYDSKARRIVEVPRNRLETRGADPALEGEYEVQTLHGKVTVRPVMELLRRSIAEYTPEAVRGICGTDADVIRKFAGLFAEAKAATNVTSSNFSKYYHGNLVERSQALLFALGGHIGRKGGGFVAFPFLTHDSFDLLTVGRTGLMDSARLYANILPKQQLLKWKGYTDEMVSYELSRESYERGDVFTCGTLFWAVHGGLLEYSGRTQEWDPYLKRPLASYLDESFEKKWQHVLPKPGEDPRMLFSFGSNILRRLRAYPLLLEHLWPKLTRITVLDWRMTSTGMFADYVLPVAAWYERDDHKWGTPLMPFLHAGRKAVESGEAWHEWRIFTTFARAIRDVARRRGVDRYTDSSGRELSLVDLYDELTYGGEFDEHAESKVAAALLERASNVAKESWETVQERGFTKFTKPGDSVVSIGNATTVEDGETWTPLVKHTRDKEPYPTLTRRIQFYIDHALYLELDEALPRHKEPPKAGGDYPLMLTGGHTRWSIHAQWRDDQLMLRQQRGEPIMYISAEDAKTRGIDDADDVVVFNDIDNFRIHAKVSPAVRPGQLIIYHAWENYQFAEGKGFQNLIPSPINPVELAGGQYHLRPMSICLQPGQFDRDTRVEVRRA
jgi:DMSO reductase family type II enzyme molybdopterin subunit